MEQLFDRVVIELQKDEESRGSISITRTNLEFLMKQTKSSEQQVIGDLYETLKEQSIEAFTERGEIGPEGKM